MKTKTKTTILPPMTATGKRRLWKLIGFLRTLPRQKFNFGDVVTEGQHNGHTCGTVCCAIGWTPAVFPRLVKWVYSPPLFAGGVAAIEVSLGGVNEYPKIAAELFGISVEAADELFTPDLQSYLHDSLPDCGRDATPKAVAAMLEKYIALTETEARP